MTTRIVSPQALKEEQIEQMFHLMDEHYEQVNEEVFRQDLLDKTWVILLKNDQIVGFSTQKLIEFEGQTAVFSGDTIIQRAHWGSQALSRAFAKHFFDYSDKPLYWFLISKGYKTYKYLPTFFKDFYPRYDKPTPPNIKRLLDGFGELLYPEDYDAETGVITYHQTKDRLKDYLQDLSEKPRDPHYQFFVEANQDFRKGNDLACLTILSRDNLLPGRDRLLFGSD